MPGLIDSVCIGFILLLTLYILRVRSTASRMLRSTEALAETNAALQQEIAELRRTADSLPEVLYRADPKTLETTYINSAVQQVFGYSVEEWMADPQLWEKRLHPEDRQMAFDAAEKALDSGEQLIAYRILQRDGPVRWVEDRARWIRDDSGEAVSISGLLTDITERKETERRLAEYREHLEEMVEERTRELSEANTAKNRFLAVMSHEIRTPMNGILGMTQRLISTGLDNHQRHCAETIHHCGTLLLTLLNDMLDLSRIETGRLELTPVDFDLRRTIAGVMEIFGEQAREKGLKLDCILVPEIPHRLWGDETRISQILVNLIGNAIKFTDHGKVNVTARAIERQDDAILLEMEVTDTGPGIDPAMHEAIFTPFTQGGAAGNRRHGGSGLGLAVTRQLAVLMNGEVIVRSAPGQGATFRIRLPLALAAPSPGVTTPTPKRRPLGAKVLLAEDNHVNLEVARAMLEDCGCRVDVVTNGHEAVEVASRVPYDLILMDCQMPLCDGFAATARIRCREREDGDAAAIPIVAMTASAMRGDRERCLDAGMNDYLSKPFTTEQLWNMLNRWVAPSSGDTDGPALKPRDSVPETGKQGRCV